MVRIEEGLEGGETYVLEGLLKARPGRPVTPMTPEQAQRLKACGVDRVVVAVMGTLAPAMGMIGTVIGLVQMLQTMSDPSTIGPAMAVALLTTLYGAVIANAFAQPMADKLGRASELEQTNKSLIIETISGIQEGMNPNAALPMLFIELFPPWLAALVGVGVLSAITAVLHWWPAPWRASRSS